MGKQAAQAITEALLVGTEGLVRSGAERVGGAADMAVQVEMAMAVPVHFLEDMVALSEEQAAAAELSETTVAK